MLYEPDFLKNDLFSPLNLCSQAPRFLVPQNHKALIFKIK